MSPLLTTVLVILSPVLMSAPIIYSNWNCPAHRIGPHQVQDGEDSALTIVHGLGLLALAGFFALLGCVGLPAALVLALVPAIWGGLKLRRQWLESRVARPATLVTSEWPLVPGRVVELGYERRIAPGIQPQSLSATLSLEEYLSGYTSRWARRIASPLQSASPAVVDGAVRATWRVTVPDDRVPRRWTFGLPTPQARFRWVVEVSMATREVEEIRSTFYLRFRLPEPGAVQPG